MNSQTQRFKVLDSWRGIAALSVALVHLPVASHVYDIGWVQNAGLFVPFFFVLSGFVIAHAYQNKLQNSQGVTQYLIRRFGRLWPMHISMLLLFLVVETIKLFLMQHHGMKAGEPAFSGATAPFAFVTSVFLVQDLNLHNTFVWNGPGWSISAEFWTYLVFAVAACFFIKKIRLVSAILTVSSGVLLFWLRNHGYVHAYQIGFVECLYCFFSGVFIYNLRKTNAGLKRISGTGLEITLLLLLVFFLTNFRVNNLPGLYYAAPVIFGLMLIVFSGETGAISRLLKKPFFLNLGKWSYSIYMVHFFIITCLNGFFRVLQQRSHHQFWFEHALPKGGQADLISLSHIQIWNDFLVLAYLGVVVVVAATTYKFIEIPGRDFFNRLAKPAR